MQHEETLDLSSMKGSSEVKNSQSKFGAKSAVTAVGSMFLMVGLMAMPAGASGAMRFP